MKIHLNVVVAALAALLAGAASAEEPAIHAFHGTVEVAFSPWDDGEALILRTLAGARRAVYVQAYILTSRKVADALIAARARGVQVEVLADAEHVLPSEGSQVPRLARAGIPVALETRYAAAHNKIMLIDPDEMDGAVLTGSYNFTYSARTKNAENLLVLRGDMALARAYLSNWRRHRAEAEAWGGREMKPVTRRPHSGWLAPALPFPWENRPGRSEGLVQ